MRKDTRLALAVTVALWLQLLPWVQLTRDVAALQAAGAAAALIMLIGWVARRLRWPALLVALVQGSGVVAASVLALWWAHGPQQVERLAALPAEGVSFIRDSSAPMFPNPGATFLIVVSLAVLALVADLVAITGERPGAAVLPVVVVHLVCGLGLSTPILFSEFALLAAGVGLVLLAASPWAASDSAGVRLAAVVTAVGITAASTGLAWVIGNQVPPFEPRRSQDPLQMNDPTLDLKRNLIQGSDDIIVRYQTDSPAGTYLKLASLPALSSDGFALSDVRVATGRLPRAPGSPPGVERTTSIEIDGFASEWLPVPYAPISFDAPGDWGFALDSLDVMAMAGPARGQATTDISYEVRSLEVRPEPAAIAAAGSTAAPRADLTGAVPDEVPEPVRALAREVTQGAPTAGAKAQALESYLLSDRFTYSTAPTTGTGDGMDTIEDFLLGSRTGYCEQFAGAMAIMAREVGIPSRMAVGFVPGTRDGDTWGVSARDLHTWPELWLDGLGWVAFEPTPARNEGGQGPAEPTEAPVSAAPSPGAGQDASPTPEAGQEALTPTPTVVPPAAPSGPAAGMLGWIILGLVVLAGVAAALLVPRALRDRRRTARLAGTGDARADTVSAWDEVRETVADARLPFPEGSPRFAAERLVGALGGDDVAIDGLRRLAAATERALYDRADHYDLPGRWADEVAAITAALNTERRGNSPHNQNARPRRAAR